MRVNPIYCLKTAQMVIVKFNEVSDNIKCEGKKSFHSYLKNNGKDAIIKNSRRDSYVFKH